MTIKYMTIDRKFHDSDADLIKVITGDGASFYMTSEEFQKVETKSLNTSGVKE